MKKIILLLIISVSLIGCGSDKEEKVTSKVETKVEKTQEPKVKNKVESIKKPVVKNTNMNKPQTEQYRAQKNTNYNGKYRVDVNRLANTVTVYTKDGYGNYNIPVKAFVCSTGGENTPLGDYYIPSRKQKLGVLFHNVYGQYTTDIVGNILFHSVPQTSPSPDTLIGAEYNKLGTTASHGCVRLAVPDAKWIMENLDTGTWVHIYDENYPGPLGKPVPLKMTKEYGVDPHYE